MAGKPRRNHNDYHNDYYHNNDNDHNNNHNDDNDHHDINHYYDYHDYYHIHYHFYDNDIYFDYHDHNDNILNICGSRMWQIQSQRQYMGCYDMPLLEQFRSRRPWPGNNRAADCAADNALWSSSHTMQ